MPLTPSWVRLPLVALAASLLFAANSLHAQQSSSTPSVFRSFSDRVVKIQVTENGSGAKASLGSGFFVTADGTIVTNYHVISQIINEPSRYHANLTNVRDSVLPVTVVAIDVVHDLAVLHSAARPARWFSLDHDTIEQGERLYSLGHPRDLGLTIVEGTYNGLLGYTLYPKIHFTGALNPGMSGGPTITEDGRVIGVNVSTAGNEISFLVPTANARDLVARTAQPGFTVPGGFVADAARQIHAYQDLYLRGMFLPNAPTVQLGHYRVPTRPASFFKCWGDAQRQAELPFVVTIHQCSTDDALFISEDQMSGVAEVEHDLITTGKLSPTQFYALYSTRFGAPEDFSGDEKFVAKFKCTTHNVTHDRTKMRVAVCVRGYTKLSGLYDAMIRVATLGATNAGVVSTLKLSGVSFENIRTLTERFVTSITWNP